MKPRCLDLFCGAGGATRGLQLAGFHVTGVDISAQPRYVGDAFFQADAMTFPLEGFDFIWASPPCQKFSALTRIAGTHDRHPNLIPATRARLIAAGIPYAIENVTGAPLARGSIMLCGSYFGLKVYRHRWFECSHHFLMAHHHVPHRDNCRIRKGISRKGFISVAGGGGFGCGKGGLAYARTAMGIEWMDRDALSQAIPPAYSQYIGEQMMPHVLRAMQSRMETQVA